MKNNFRLEIKIQILINKLCFQELVYLMNGFYILAHDYNKLETTLDIVNNAIRELEVKHQSKLFN